MTETVAWIAVDWGTSNLRAWGIAGNGDVLASTSSDKGMGKLSPPDYPGVLAEIVGNLAPATPALPVLICGMAGARQGWKEAPYLEAPADLRDLAAHAVRPESSGTDVNVSILPGVCQRQNGDDVMRGEETQLLGLAGVVPGYSGLVCMPGTHSKWAMLSGTRLESFSTVMTGEMYELLRVHSVLRHSLGGSIEEADRQAGFAAGAADGLDAPDQLLGRLFRVRAGALLSARSSGWCSGYLSGLLIGSEVAAKRSMIGPVAVPLIGSPALCALYQQVLEMAGLSGQPHDATEVTLSGLRMAHAAQLQG
ncbi:MAG: 2-dehydro-3-deoxygalactonokinase [Devosia sp.]|uniref:2-dehydro-3-deoxygalactonokinase n=1 Tax=Devosia sp. TaxID=1871048 RepID=UPI0024C67728|nr:2-dehydro-3-deoxygalactonokinase [Devosia sp.]UYO00339.1 MAG: 2-dehydro-3-deoxygalactonokinase [Devosia sp.]